jgi:hypothetical protein
MAMTLLATPAEVIELSFIQDETTPMYTGVILDTFIKAAEVLFILPLIGTSLYNAVYTDPVTFAALIGEIKPCLAYYSKLLSLNDFLYSEDTNFKDLSSDAKKQLLKSTQNIADALANSLINYIKTNHPKIYIAPTKKRVAGLLIKS